MMRYKMAYCTLNSVIQQLNADSNDVDVTTTSAENVQIALESANFKAYTTRLIYEVSAVMTGVMRHVFVPYRNSLTLKRTQLRRALIRYATEWQLGLSEEILEAHSLTWLGASVDSSYFWLSFNGEFYPDVALSIDILANISLPYSGDQTVVLDGTFGYHRNPDAMFEASGTTVQNNPLTSSGTTLSVGSGQGSSFEILQYLRVEEEYMMVTAISGDDLTVRRGVNGTTATAHAQNTAIEKYVPLPEIENEARRLVKRHWQLKGWPENAFIVSPEEVIEINPNAVQKLIQPLPLMGSV